MNIIRFYLIAAIAVFSFSFVSAASLTCEITSAASCSGTPVLYVQNDTGGYENAHAQNVSNATFAKYNNALCCSSPAGVGNSCNQSSPSENILLRLSNSTNSHVQVDNYSRPGAEIYNVYACLSANTGTASCIYRNNSCPADYTCLGTIASSESENNLTNAHYSSCGKYNVTICCKITDPISSPSVSSVTDSSSGGGGGGSGASGKSLSDVAVRGQPAVIINPTDISFSVILPKTGNAVEQKQEVDLINNKNEEVKVNVETIGLDGVYVEPSDKEIILRPNEIRTIYLVATSKAKGLLAGKLLVRFDNTTSEIRVVVNVKSENFLFDTSIFIPFDKKRIKPGEEIIAQVDLKEVASKEKANVNAMYIIKDFEGKVYYKRSEELSVQGQKSYTISIPSAGMPEGDYIIGLDVSYEGAFATASAQFEIVQEEALGNEQTIVLVMLLIVTIVALGIAIWVKFLNKKIISFFTLRRKV